MPHLYKHPFRLRSIAGSSCGKTCGTRAGFVAAENRAGHVCTSRVLCSADSVCVLHLCVPFLRSASRRTRLRPLHQSVQALIGTKGSSDLVVRYTVCKSATPDSAHEL